MVKRAIKLETETSRKMHIYVLEAEGESEEYHTLRRCLLYSVSCIPAAWKYNYYAYIYIITIHPATLDKFCSKTGALGSESTLNVTK